MHNCSDDILRYHDDEVTLPKSERDGMRSRRDANRDRLKTGLKKAERQAPREFKSQGSYAMKTMTQHPEKSYDVDDGVYFNACDLMGARGAEMSSLDARQMVRDAVDDRSFKRAPEVRRNCVRVFYDAGYHVDMPTYRRVETEDVLGRKSVHHELASAAWKRSDARDVTEWFENVNEKQSPDTENGRQLRRVTRLVKKFAKSRQSWEDQILSGFGITVLISECYRADAEREDIALYETMLAMKTRLDLDLVLKHPLTPDETITNGTDDAKARFLRDKLAEAIESLQPLLEAACERKTALRGWDKVFSTTFFIGRFKEAEELKEQSVHGTNALAAGILKSLATSEEARAAVRKEGGGRYA